MPAAQIVACLREAYALPVVQVAFLPLGADLATAVYRAVADDGSAYFLKLRRGSFHAATVQLPHMLSQRGMAQLIAPRPTQTGALWTQLNSFTAVLFPFVAGQHGFAQALSERHWTELGAALRMLHAMDVPPALARTIPREDYGAQWRAQVTAYQALVAMRQFDEPAAAQLARLLTEQDATIRQIVARAGQLGRALAAQPPEQCLCHGDIHAGNVLIDGADQLRIVDWDTLIFAPKERDLMFVGAGVGGVWNDDQEVAWFYNGYGDTTINQAALAYYRYERIVQDIAVTCVQLLESDAGGDDRAEALHQLRSQFAPRNVVAMAQATDAALQG